MSPNPTPFHYSLPISLFQEKYKLEARLADELGNVILPGGMQTTVLLIEVTNDMHCNLTIGNYILRKAAVFT